MSKYWKLRYELTFTLLEEAFDRLLGAKFGTAEYSALRAEWEELMELLDEL